MADDQSDGGAGVGGGGQALVTDDFILWVFPGLKALGGGFLFERGGVVFLWVVDHGSLGEGEEGEESEPDEDSDPGDLPEADQRGGFGRNHVVEHLGGAGVAPAVTFRDGRDARAP